MRRSRIRPPYFTSARFDGLCAETGQAIRKGDRVAYYPSTGKVFADSSKQADELRGQQFATAHGMADAGY
jgi:hypothetical protein